MVRKKKLAANKRECTQISSTQSTFFFLIHFLVSNLRLFAFIRGHSFFSVLRGELCLLFWLAAKVQPFSVESAGLVDALIRVGAEVIALGLQQIGRQTILTDAVVIG
jgi:hypothetical protein